jgi:CheY-like chemotaxis protein
MRIYLPRVFDPVITEPPEGPETEASHGTETVLVVEDEDEVRRLVSELLEQRGYTVLSAAQPQEAIEICNAHAGPIELLLTDVVMPQMDGRELAEKAAWIRPAMKVLFMSGYTEDTVAAETSEFGLAFLRKPFTPAALARKIRDVLETRSQGMSAAAE